MKAVRFGFFLLLIALALLPQAFATKVSAEVRPITRVAYAGSTYTLWSPGMPCTRPSVTTLKDFGTPDVDSSGRVAFTAIYDEAPIRALFSWSSGSGLQYRIADNDQAPGYIDRCLQLAPTALGNNSSTDLAFGATMVDVVPPIAPPIQAILLAGAPGAASTVVADGMTSPIGGSFSGPALLDFDDAGRVLFSSNVVGGSAPSGLFRAAGPGGPYTTVAKVGDPAPGGGTFTSIGSSSMNNSGQVAFYATIGGGGGGGGIFRWDGSSVQKVVRPGDTWFTYYDAKVAGDVNVTFTTVSEPRINDGGTVSFRATASGTYGDGYFAIQPGPTTSKLVLLADGSPVDGSAFTSLSSPGQHVLENGDQLVVKGTMSSTVSEALFSFPAFDALVVKGQKVSPPSSTPTFEGFFGAAVSEPTGGGSSSVAFAGQDTGPCPPFLPPLCHGIYAVLNLVVLPPADSDGDGLYDSWEQNGIDTNNDGTIDLNLPAMGANKNHKDVFVEVDYLDCAGNGRNADNAAGLPADCAAADNHSHQPTQAGINNVVAAFANAPVNNPDGTTGINLHVTVDEALAHANFLDFPGNGPPACNPGVGGQVGISNYMQVKAVHFGTAADRASPNWNNIKAAKQNVFHYALFSHQQMNGNTSSGCGEIWGNDFYVSLGGWTNGVGTQGEQEGTFMHELGHNLNLQHGGGDGLNYKPNYLSVMNYTFQMPKTPVNNVATNRPLDYSRWALPPNPPAGPGLCQGNPAGTLTEANLNENCGIDNKNPPAGLNAWNTAYSYYDANKDICPFAVVAAVGGIDWNSDGDKVDNPVTWGINDPDSAPDDGSPPGEPGQVGPNDPNNPGHLLELCQYNNTQQLNGFDDWSNLKYFNAGQANFGNGLPNFPLPPEPEVQAPAASAVGGIAELPDAAQAPGRQSNSSAGGYAALAGGLAAAIVILGAGAWYGRRRWLR